MASAMVPVGRLQVATPASMALAIRNATEAQRAVDERIVPVAAGVLADNPGLIAAAVALAQQDADLQRASSSGTSRVTEYTDPMWSEITLTRDFRRAGGTLRSGGTVGGSGPGWTETASPFGSEVITLTRDYRVVQPGGEASPDGRTPQATLDEYATRIGARLALSGLTGWGDSMTTKYGATTVNQTEALAAELGLQGVDFGVSGDTPFQIAWRMGALDLRVTLPGDTLPASGPVAVTVNRPTGWNQTRNWPCVIRNSAGVKIPVVLRHGATSPGATPSWTLEQASAGVAQTILAGTRIAHEQTHNQVGQANPATVWMGRNDVNQARVEEALRAILAVHRDPYRRLLVRPIFNNASEPSGSGGYTTLMTINASIAQIAGPAFFDDRAELIRHGLSIAGITPTAADTTAIAEDRIPPSLMLDTIHLNDAGRLALARIDAIEINGRNWS